LEAYELRKRVLPLAEALGEIMPTWKELDRWEQKFMVQDLRADIDFGRESHSDLILRASSLLASLQQADASETGVFDNAPRARQTNFYDSLDGTHTYVVIPFVTSDDFLMPLLFPAHSVSGTTSLRYIMLVLSLILCPRLHRNGPVSLK